MCGAAAGAAGPVAAARTLLDIATSASKISDDRRFDALLDSAAAALGRRDAHAESLLHVASELDDAERAALRDSAGRVAARLAERVRGRLEPLLLA